jgi:hypothetical protein
MSVPGGPKGVYGRWDCEVVGSYPTRNVMIGARLCLVSCTQTPCDGGDIPSEETCQISYGSAVLELAVVLGGVDDS